MNHGRQGRNPIPREIEYAFPANRPTNRPCPTDRSAILLITGIPAAPGNITLKYYSRFRRHWFGQLEKKQGSPVPRESTRRTYLETKGEPDLSGFKLQKLSSSSAIFHLLFIQPSTREGEGERITSRRRIYFYRLVKAIGSLLLPSPRRSAHPLTVYPFQSP